MPLHVRSTAITIAVICFFGIAVIGGISGLSPFTCCKRAVAAAMFAYIVATCCVKAINAILMDAMITKQINKQKGNSSGTGD